jgi:hypothetical protein
MRKTQNLYRRSNATSLRVFNNNAICCMKPQPLGVIFFLVTPKVLVKLLVKMLVSVLPQVKTLVLPQVKMSVLGLV